ncbi:MAG TPA: SoxY-related AACIE arm protein [Burkholderiales bacterium]|jgi:sulfur-oxidizing protein SoxY|nr:SoxY-related AACIE arm protein [Burkholderiales bacterium]
MTTRRQFLALACGTLAAGELGAQLDPNIQAKRKAALEAAISKVVGDAPLRVGKVTLDVPPLIDNGNTVPVSVTVDSPMTAASHVKAIHIFTEKNPQPYVITAHLGPRAGRATVSTRARIADTGLVIAIAELSDGSYWSDSVSVVVTLSACLEEGLI